MAARAERLGDDPAHLGRRAARPRGPVRRARPERRRRSQAEAGRWERELARRGSGLELAHVQEAGLLGEQREHFGFTDGFSQPAIEGVAREDIRGQGIPYKRAPWWPLSRTQWRAVKPGEFVLGYEDEDSGPPPAPPAPFDRNASFMVWRKLHQDVAGFRAQLAEQAAAPAARRGARRGQAGRALARRQPAGAAPGRPRPGAGQRQGARQRLPLRRRRARAALPARRPRAAHEPARRARLGGPAHRAPPDPAPRDALWPGRCPTAPPDDGAARGLLFVCLQASISRQFEIVQTQWCNDGNAFGLGREADPISGPRGGRGPPHHRGRPAARGLAAAQLRRVPRRRVPRRAGDQRAAGAARRCRRAVTKRRGERGTHGGRRWNTVPRHVTPPGQTNLGARCHDESRTCTPFDADPPHQ